MLAIPHRSRKTFVLHTFKSSFGGLLMPIRINTQHLDAAPAFDLPILQPFFFNPVAITHRRFSVDEIVYDVYAAHPAGVLTKANSTVVIVKRWGGKFPGAGPTHLWEEDRVDAVVAIKAFFKMLVPPMNYVTPLLCCNFSIITRTVVRSWITTNSPMYGHGSVSVHCDLHHINEGVAIPSLKRILEKPVEIHHIYRMLNTPPTPIIFDIFFTCDLQSDGSVMREAVFMRRVGTMYGDIRVVHAPQLNEAMNWFRSLSEREMPIYMGGDDDEDVE